MSALPRATPALLSIMKMHPWIQSAAFLLCAASSLAGAAPVLEWSVPVDAGGGLGAHVKAVGSTAVGDVIVVAQTGSATAAQIRVQRLAKSTGQVLWTRDVGTALRADDAADLVVDPSTGDSYIAARAATATNGIDWFVFKVNGTNGALGWGAGYTYGSVGNDEPRAIAFTSDGNIAVAGMETVVAATRLRVAKLNASTGALMWGFTSKLDGTQAADVAGDGSGNVVVVGRNGGDAYTLKLTSVGEVSWQQTYSAAGVGQDAWNALALFSNGDVAAAGYAVAETGDQNLTVVRYPAAGGAPSWTFSVGGTANANDAAYDVAIDGAGDVYTAGMVRNTATGQAAYLGKVTGSTGFGAWASIKSGTSTAAEATDAYFSIRPLGSDVVVLGTIANASADILLSRFAALDGSLREDTLFGGAAGKDDTVLGKNLLAVTETGFVFGGDTESAAPLATGIVRRLRLVSSNADLSGLAILQAPLSPTFTSSRYDGYQASVLNTTATITVTATFAQANATAQVRVNAGTQSNLGSGIASGPLALNMGQNTVQVRVLAEDGVSSRTYAFVVTRLTGLESWRKTYFPDSTAATGPGADIAAPQGDGVSNLLKFAMGLDPTKPGVVPITFTREGDFFIYSYSPSAAALGDGLSFLLEFSDTLAADSWIPSTVDQPGISSGGALVRVTVPPGAGNRRFVRLKVVR